MSGFVSSPSFLPLPPRMLQGIPFPGLGKGLLWKTVFIGLLSSVFLKTCKSAWEWISGQCWKKPDKSFGAVATGICAQHGC